MRPSGSTPTATSTGTEVTLRAGRKEGDRVQVHVHEAPLRLRRGTSRLTVLLDSGPFFQSGASALFTFRVLVPHT